MTDTQSLETQIGILGQKFEDLSARVERGFREIKESTVARIDDHEIRIRNNETFQNTLNGKIWGIGIMTGGIMSIITLVAEYFIRK